MRLPECLTRISPVRETLEAMDCGLAALEHAAAEENGRLSPDTADDRGLSLWEADYSLQRQADEAARRDAIRAALRGGQGATVKELEALCADVGGFDHGEVEEEFSAYAFTVYAVTDGRMPPDAGPLRTALERRCPAHLHMTVVPCAAPAREPAGLHAALLGRIYIEVRT